MGLAYGSVTAHGAGLWVSDCTLIEAYGSVTAHGAGLWAAARTVLLSNRRSLIKITSTFYGRWRKSVVEAGLLDCMMCLERCWF